MEVLKKSLAGNSSADVAPRAVGSRVERIKTRFFSELYRKVSRSLLNQHQLLFKLLLAANIQLVQVRVTLSDPVTSGTGIGIN